MSYWMKQTTMIVVLGLALVGSGCTKSMTPGKMQWVRADSDQQRAGNTYLLRGWIGIFSSGIDNLTQQINDSGVRAHVYQDDQWADLAKHLRDAYRADPNHEPLCLVGHSYGADDVLRVARELKKDNIPVDLIVTLDPVTPIDVPTNVKHCVNIYQSNGVWDTMPWLRGVPIKAETTSTQLVNYNIRVDRTDLLEADTDHFNIEKKQKIHSEILKYVLQTCPSREMWVAAHRSYMQPQPQQQTQAPLQQAIPARSTIQPQQIQRTSMAR